MSNPIIEEDHERSFQMDSLYLQEKEHEMWLWYCESMKTEEGEIIFETERIFEPELPFKL